MQVISEQSIKSSQVRIPVPQSFRSSFSPIPFRMLKVFRIIVFYNLIACDLATGDPKVPSP